MPVMHTRSLLATCCKLYHVLPRPSRLSCGYTGTKVGNEDAIHEYALLFVWDLVSHLK